MSPEEFIKKWRAVTVSEIAASQSHFNDLCELIDEPKPLDIDPKGEHFAFEKPLSKASGTPGRAARFWATAGTETVAKAPAATISTT